MDAMTEKAENERLTAQVGTFRAYARSCQNAKDRAEREAERLRILLADQEEEIKSLKAELKELKSSEWYRSMEQAKKAIAKRGT